MAGLLGEVGLLAGLCGQMGTLGGIPMPSPWVGLQTALPLSHICDSARLQSVLPDQLVLFIGLCSGRITTRALTLDRTSGCVLLSGRATGHPPKVI